VKSAAVRDGSHDFDFIYEKWRMPNHRLKKRLAGSNEGDDFITCDEGSSLPGGIGDIDYWTASYWKDFVGVTVRTYDPGPVFGTSTGLTTNSLEASFNRQYWENSMATWAYSKAPIPSTAYPFWCASLGPYPQKLRRLRRSGSRR
jgi:hypothetical protein